MDFLNNAVDASKAAAKKASQTATLIRAGLSMDDIEKFEAAGNSQPHVVALLKTIADDKDMKPETENKLLSAMAKKWKSDSALFTKIERDLTVNPKLGEAIALSVKKNPDLMIDALAKYKGENLPALLGIPPEPVSAQNAPPAKETKAAANVAAASPKTKPKPTAPAAVVAASSQVPDAASVGPGEEILPRRESKLAGGPDIGDPKKTEAAPKDAGPKPEVLEMFIAASDDDLKDIMTPEITAKMLSGIADKAQSLGADKTAVDGFRKAVQDPTLQQRIATNLQKNPDFVRSMAKMAQEKTPMNDSMKQAVKQELTKFMQQPELLADDSHIKKIQKQMEDGKKMQEMFAQFMGPLKSGMNNMMTMASGLMGQHSVISMGTSGGLLPNLLINLHNFGRNQDEYRAFANYSPSEMTALSKPGKDGFFHTVIKKDAQGNETKVEVPNGQITVRTAEGKDVDIIPSVGALMAKQRKGSVDANGNFVPGVIVVPVVTSIDKYGVASSIKNINMTETEFAKYKAQADALGKNIGGPYNQLAFQNYTAQDLAEAQQKTAKVNVAQVNPQSGEVFHVTAQPNLLRPVAAEPVRQVAGSTPVNAANERDFTMQG